MKPSGFPNRPNPWPRYAEKAALLVAALVTLNVGATLLDWNNTLDEAAKLVAAVRVATPKPAPEEKNGETPQGVSAKMAPPNDPRATRGPSQPNAEPTVHDQLADDIAKRNMFYVKRDPTLTGLLGDRAYFSDGQSAAVGDSMSMGKVTAMGGDWVELELEVDGAKKTMNVFGGSGGPAPPSAPSRSSGAKPIGKTKVNKITVLGGGGASRFKRPEGVSSWQYLKGLPKEDQMAYYRSLPPDQQKQLAQQKTTEFKGGGSSKSGSSRSSK
jgi:hypothetical protein